MLFKKLLIIVFVLTGLHSATAAAGGWSAALSPINTYVHSVYGYFFVVDEDDPDLANPDNCSHPHLILILPTTNLSKEMYATGLAASMAGKKTQFYLVGCAFGLFPEVKHLQAVLD